MAVEEWQVPLWDAINRYVVACGGDPSKHVYGNTPRMNAVGEVNAVVRAAVRAAESRSRGEYGWGVWITQDKDRTHRLWRSYWWQGPEYKGDQILTRAEAEREAARLQSTERKWTYEARPYVSPKPPR